MSNANLNRPRSDNGKNVLIALLVAGIGAFGAGVHYGEADAARIVAKAHAMIPAAVISAPVQSPGAAPGK